MIQVETNKKNKTNKLLRGVLSVLAMYTISSSFCDVAKAESYVRANTNSKKYSLEYKTEKEFDTLVQNSDAIRKITTPYMNNLMSIIRCGKDGDVKFSDDMTSLVVKDKFGNVYTLKDENSNGYVDYATIRTPKGLVLRIENYNEMPIVNDITKTPVSLSDLNDMYTISNASKNFDSGYDSLKSIQKDYDSIENDLEILNGYNNRNKYKEPKVNQDWAKGFKD